MKHMLETSGRGTRRLALALVLTLLLAGCSTSIPTGWTSGSSAADANVVITASVSNASPAQHSPVTVAAQLLDNGQPVANAPMKATWHYRTTTPSCTGQTGSDGVASCRRSIGGATLGYPVQITVALIWNGQTYTAQTSFTPR